MSLNELKDELSDGDTNAKHLFMVPISRSSRAL